MIGGAHSANFGRMALHIRDGMQGLNDMYLFSHVVDFGGLSAAARALRIPKSTVARRIAALETLLGTPLFHRTAKGVVLTTFGHQCHKQCARLAAEADGVFALAARMRDTPTGFLHVVYPPFLGGSLIEDVASSFARREPGVQLHLESSTTLLDPRSISADLVLHYATEDLPKLDVIARKLQDNPFVLVISPERLDDSGLPRALQDLRRFPAIGFGAKANSWAWTLQCGGEFYTHRFSPVISTENLSAAVSAARHGLGIAALPYNVVKPDIDAGRLLRVLPDWQPRAATLFAIYPSRRALTKAARQFLDLMIDTCRERQRSLEPVWRQDGISY